MVEKKSKDEYPFVTHDNDKNPSSFVHLFVYCLGLFCIMGISITQKPWDRTVGLRRYMVLSWFPPAAWSTTHLCGAAITRFACCPTKPKRFIIQNFTERVLTPGLDASLDSYTFFVGARWMLLKYITPFTYFKYHSFQQRDTISNIHY